jgi:hypothetical protein
VENFYTLFGFCQSFVEVERRIQGSGDRREGKEWWNNGMMEYWNHEMPEWRNIGTME